MWNLWNLVISKGAEVLSKAKGRRNEEPSPVGRDEPTEGNLQLNVKGNE